MVSYVAFNGVRCFLCNTVHNCCILGGVAGLSMLLQRNSTLALYLLSKVGEVSIALRANHVCLSSLHKILQPFTEQRVKVFVALNASEYICQLWVIAGFCYLMLTAPVHSHYGSFQRN